MEEVRGVEMKNRCFRKQGERLCIGDKVVISDLSGIDSRKVVTLVSSEKIKTDGRGIPTNVAGAYNPVDWDREVAFMYPDGEYGTMFKDRILPYEVAKEMYKKIGGVRE